MVKHDKSVEAIPLLTNQLNNEILSINQVLEIIQAAEKDSVIEKLALSPYRLEDNTYLSSIIELTRLVGEKNITVKNLTVDRPGSIFYSENKPWCFLFGYTMTTMTKSAPAIENSINALNRAFGPEELSIICPETMAQHLRLPSGVKSLNLPVQEKMFSAFDWLVKEIIQPDCELQHLNISGVTKQAEFEILEHALELNSQLEHPIQTINLPAVSLEPTPKSLISFYEKKWEDLFGNAAPSFRPSTESLKSM